MYSCYHFERKGSLLCQCLHSPLWQILFLPQSSLFNYPISTAFPPVLFPCLPTAAGKQKSSSSWKAAVLAPFTTQSIRWPGEILFLSIKAVCTPSPPEQFTCHTCLRTGLKAPAADRTAGRTFSPIWSCTNNQYRTRLSLNCPASAANKKNHCWIFFKLPSGSLQSSGTGHPVASLGAVQSHCQHE